MAGHRRGTGRPTRAQTRADRRRLLLASRLGRARSPAEQLAAAADYARAVLTDLPPAAADLLARELVAALTTAADRAARPTNTPTRRQR